MAEINLSAQVTLVELANRSKNKEIINIANALAQRNEVWRDPVWVKANGLTSHKFSKWVSEPTGSWTQVNLGVATEAGQTQPAEEGMGFLEAYSKVDARLVELASNKQKFLTQEETAFLRGMSKEFARVLFYGNTEDVPEEIDGFATRYDALGDNCVSAGGSGSDLSSIWVVEWGDDACHLIYPENSGTALKRTPKGIITVYDASNNPYEAYLTHFQLKVGLVVRIDEAVQRICNLETSGSSNIFDPDDLINAIINLPSEGKRAVIYMNKTIFKQLQVNAKDKTNVHYQPDNPYGGIQYDFMGIPIRIVEQIIDTESAVS